MAKSNGFNGALYGLNGILLQELDAVRAAVGRGVAEESSQPSGADRSRQEPTGADRSRHEEGSQPEGALGRLIWWRGKGQSVAAPATNLWTKSPGYAATSTSGRPSNESANQTSRSGPSPGRRS